MSEKQKLIRQMIQRQKQFIARRRERGESTPPDEPAELSGHSGESEKIALRVVDLAHRERGTSR
ncbi:MAG: hypothetical protein OXU22_08160 [Gammaproteobacteria bacterium]|nr:hypothetical protein [Gammaproteobacteria bacterium]